MSHIFKNPEGLAGGAAYSVTRTANGLVSTVAVVDSKTLTLTRGVNNALVSVTDGTYTWTWTRDSNNKISAKAITEV